MKKIVIFIVMILCMLMTSISLAADVKVQINGEIVDFTDSNGDKVEAQTINSRTMVPLRKIFEILGCKIDWNGDTKEIKATKDNRIIEMQIDNKNVSFTIDNDKESKELDQAPIIKDNRTLVPLRFISEALDMQVGWDAQNSTAIIIDYNELAKILMNKSSYIFNSFVNTSSVTLTKNYYDDAYNSNNSTTKIEINENGNNKENKTINVQITGNSDFVKEVESEEWNSFSYDAFDDGSYQTANYVFSNMLFIKKNEKAKVYFERFNLSKDVVNSIEELVRCLSVVDDGAINVNTYDGLKSDWTKFASVFLEGTSKKLVVDNFIFDYIDLNKLFTQRLKSESITALQLFNSLFKVAGDYNELFFLYPDVEYSFTGENGQITIKFYIKNEYKEREEYILTFKG